MCSVDCEMCIVQCTLAANIVQYEVCNMPCVILYCAVRTVQCTVRSFQFAVCSVLYPFCSVYFIGVMLSVQIENLASLRVNIT